ncbi:hypothetical protein GUITHDRAFT_111147 [Guillardia theta CCMP2712]|uniref:RWP-RK domain-containing protein n=1 Tax=Guillardia theta (strain CCMP2712) TaxID=905079 RepID=L1J3B7_GUITC|nr:hypothetical protein GUITHDRAFT_111147 [Guillardia theta CCMP2712]EKX42777.1 hypothetical protein GUITHDRAFT_111147 [Guillardia theta CCMP2712]|eukprot:XP_005829757.1 hypothetical protein GUITHDRAFT_111147 [Guillardia theta CCMP2712]
MASQFLNQDSVTIAPRPRAGERQSPLEVRLSVDALAPLFNTPQDQAAQLLGISLTSLKSACRRLGIPRWPYRRGTKKESNDSITSETRTEIVTAWFEESATLYQNKHSTSALQGESEATNSWIDEFSPRAHLFCEEQVNEALANEFLVVEDGDEDTSNQANDRMGEWIKWFVTCEDDDMHIRPFY